MAAAALPAAGTPFGDRVRRRLADERVIWFTTVGADGTPQPNPVWFVLDGDEVLVFNRPDAHRLAHLRRSPHVSLHFDGDGAGGDIVVLRGTARITEGDGSSPEAMPAYREKYAEGMVTVSGDATRFAEEYPVPVRIRIEKVRGY
ncbi:TIGR03667 family PPOX class F420-dependent oxidoreductase [Prauserella cavernicola]|uniref:TIGR03667 family PPOX class F420-dependent oxidoreductase n=1 Tax=Prauserella cavernicola TaxID=2800127 RepID=A0A934QUY9_9PSEU|nr:TIGR03667 family PPOX class F420-dependent oxidoreductase [Prauserella cavernicola]MBK1786975.1 TIGR03667 family PPOX class F420-dependent oxidoreductase [Prauserella cavernicola]